VIYLSEIKTCEEYVLAELERYKNNSLELEEALNEALMRIDKLTSSKSIKLSDVGGTAYYCDGISVTYYNDILKNYNLEPSFLEDCLKSSILLEEFMSYSLNSFRVGEVIFLNYDFKLLYNDLEAVCKINDANNKWLKVKCIDNSKYFLDLNLCKEAIKNLVISNIKIYFDMGLDKSFKV